MDNETKYTEKTKAYIIRGYHRAECSIVPDTLSTSVERCWEIFLKDTPKPTIIQRLFGVTWKKLKKDERDMWEGSGYYCMAVDVTIHY